MRLLAWNVQHRGASAAPAQAEAILAAKPDVVVLSEFVPRELPDPLLSLLAAGGLTSSAMGVAGDGMAAYTVAIASRNALDRVEFPFAGTPWLFAALEVEIAGVTVVGAYFPLGDQHDLFWDGAFRDYANAVAKIPAVIAGDWNTGSRSLDIGGGDVAGMDRFDDVVASGWTDAWRTRHPGEREYSWHHNKVGNGFRLDHALLSPPLASTLHEATYLHNLRTGDLSDHSALVVDLDVNPAQAPEEGPAMPEVLAPR